MTQWDQIRREHAEMVWSTVARILKSHEDSLDCCQDVFAEAIQRSRRERVKDWGGLLRWLATRRAIDYLRRRRRRNPVSHDLEQVDAAAQSAEQKVAFAELVELVRSELAHLPPRQAEAFWLVCVEERTYDEVARQMQIQRNAVGVLVHRARQHMRVKLKAYRPIQAE